MTTLIDNWMNHSQDLTVLSRQAAGGVLPELNTNPAQGVVMFPSTTDSHATGIKPGMSFRIRRPGIEMPSADLSDRTPQFFEDGRKRLPLSETQSLQRRPRRQCWPLILVVTLAALITANGVQAQEQPAADSDADKPTENGGYGVATPAVEPRVVDYNNPTLEDILAAWREREEKVTSWDFVWDETSTYYALPAEFRSSMDKRRENETLSYKNGRFAHRPQEFHYISFPLSADPKLMKPLPIVMRFSESASSQFLKFDGQRHGEVTIRPEHHFPYPLQSEFIGVVAEYRPAWFVCVEPVSLADAMAPGSEFGVTAELIPGEGQTRDVVLSSIKNRRVVLTVELQPGFPVVRGTTQTDPNVPNVIDSVFTVEIKRDEVAGYIPTRWKGTKYNGLPVPMEEVSSTLVSAKINEPLSDKLFDHLDHPVGTMITDERPGKPGEKQPYWLREGGRLEPVDLEEERKLVLADHEQHEAKRRAAFKTETRTVWSDIVDHIIWIQVGILLILAGVWIYRRRST